MRMISPKFFLYTCVFMASVVIAAPVSSQTYQSWNNPDAPAQQTQAANDEKLRNFVEQLNKLIDQAERDKAAAPLFLRDLRDLANDFDRPWTSLILYDDFADGNYNRNPVWVVAAGRYWIEKNWGLRNGIDKTGSSSSGSSSNSTSKDAAAILFGKILNQALGGAGSTTNSGTSTTGIQPTAIYSNVKISNAFSIELDVSSWVNEGSLAIGPYQGDSHNVGYRLIYTVGGSIELITKSALRTRTLDINSGPFNLEDKKTHTIEWTRGRDGMMKISLDGKILFELLDLSFRDPFDGFGMATSGGDFIIKRVSIYAAP